MYFLSWLITQVELFLVSRQFIKRGSLRKYRVQNITSINNWFGLRFKISDLRPSADKCQRGSVIYTSCMLIIRDCHIGTLVIIIIIIIYLYFMSMTY